MLAAEDSFQGAIDICHLSRLVSEKVREALPMVLNQPTAILLSGTFTFAKLDVLLSSHINKCVCVCMFPSSIIYTCIYTYVFSHVYSIKIHRYWNQGCKSRAWVRSRRKHARNLSDKLPKPRSPKV